MPQNIHYQNLQSIFLRFQETADRDRKANEAIRIPEINKRARDSYKLVYVVIEM